MEVKARALSFPTQPHLIRRSDERARRTAAAAEAGAASRSRRATDGRTDGAHICEEEEECVRQCECQKCATWCATRTTSDDPHTCLLHCEETTSLSKETRASESSHAEDTSSVDAVMKE